MMEDRREKIDFIIDARKDISANTIKQLTVGMTDEELNDFYDKVWTDVKDMALNRG